jgi:hypothetical protein
VEASITHEDKEKEGKGTKIEEKTEVMRHPSHPWTLVQGFYAQMGGFVLDSTGVYPDFLPESRTTLDLESFRFLLIFAALPFFEPPRKSSKIVWLDEQQIQEEHENKGNHQSNHESKDSESPLFSNSKICQGLDISRSYISDKSNASGLAKAMVCIQALWFCIQALSRVLRSLPITLLELNTFAHSLCALLIYILWWHKPLDVEQATSLPVRDAQAISIWAFLHKGEYFDPLGRAELSKGLRSSLRQIK